MKPAGLTRKAAELLRAIDELANVALNATDNETETTEYAFVAIGELARSAHDHLDDALRQNGTDRLGYIGAVAKRLDERKAQT